MITHCRSSSHHLTSHTTWPHLTTNHITSHQVTPHHITLYHITPHHTPPPTPRFHTGWCRIFLGGLTTFSTLNFRPRLARVACDDWISAFLSSLSWGSYRGTARVRATAKLRLIARIFQCGRSRLSLDIMTGIIQFRGVSESRPSSQKQELEQPTMVEQIVGF